MRALAVASVIITVIALASGCSGDTGPSGRDAKFVMVPSPHGSIPCVVLGQGSTNGGISCDWSYRR